jgi:hypothetical protein
MAMNETLRETMRQELVQSRGGFGIAVGVLSYFGLFLLIAFIPGVDVLMKDHDWPGWVILAVSVAAGWIAGALRTDAIRNEIQRMDDDTLKFRHDKMSRKKQESSLVFYLVVALVVAYFIFRN